MFVFIGFGAGVLLFIFIFLTTWAIRRRRRFENKIKRKENKEGNRLVVSCIDRSKHVKNKYMYPNVRNEYDDDDTFREKCQAAGIKFEQNIQKRIEKFLKMREITGIEVKYQWRLGMKNICDLALLWRGIDGISRVIIIECKHSSSRKSQWVNSQVTGGLNQLHRYADYIRRNYRKKIEAMVLITDFPWDKNLPANLRRDVLMINGFEMLEIFMDELVKIYQMSTLPLKQTLELDFEEISA